MPSFWSSPYEPVAQDDKVSESAPAQLSENAPKRSEQWLGRAVLCIAVANVLIALATVIATRDISKIRFPIAGMDVSALPRPDPYVGLHLQG